MKQISLNLFLNTVLSGMLLLSAGIAAELPANIWVKVGQKEAGCRKGSAVVWLKKEKKFLVAGGISDNKWTRGEKIPAPYGMMTFDPASRKWAEYKPGAKAGTFKYKKRALFGSDGQGHMELSQRAAISSSFTFDPAGNRMFLYQAGEKVFNIYEYSVEGRNWKLLSSNRPPSRSNGVWLAEYGKTTCFMEGTSQVFDPVNNELLFIGGRTGNDVKGFVGHWALSIKEQKWRQLTAADPKLDPLREKVAAAIAPARDGMAAARNIYYAGMETAKESEALKAAPSKLLAEASAKAKAALKALKGATTQGWKKTAVALATAGLQKALAGLDTTRQGLAAGKINAQLLKSVFDSAWLLDEAVDCLRTVPGARKSAGVGYDPVSKSIVIFGGDHGDYLLNDTWVYDCAKKSWRQAFPKVAPKARRASGKMLWLPGQKKLALAGGNTYKPRFIYFRRTASSFGDVWTFDVKNGQWQLVNSGGGKGPQPSLTCALAAGAGDMLLGLSSKGRWRGITADYWMLRIAPAGGVDASKVGAPAGTRTYFTVVKEYDPRWYDAAPRGDRKSVDTWIKKLPTNTWTVLPAPPHRTPQRSWGTCVFDPDRDQWYFWTGGHMADPADIVSTYHPAINRWSIPYIASYVGKGISFQGRPDCMNHTYTNYAYDPLSKKLILTNFGGTCVYDPDRREYEPRIDHPFRQHPYTTLTVSTPKGVVCRERGYLGLLDVKERKWKKLPLKGKLYSPQTDGSGLCYDSKRNVIWMGSLAGYQKVSGKIWRYDMETGVAEELTPGNIESIGRNKRAFRTIREIVYLPKLDLLLFNNICNGKQVAYDPEKNSWVLLDLARNPKDGKVLKDLGGVNIGLMYDAKRDLLWAMSGSRRMFVIKIDAKTVKIIRDVPKPEPKPAAKKK
jgi:Galactose oxidase, central domain